MNWWQLFTRAFTPEECKLIIEHAQKIAPQQGTIGHGGKSVVDSGYRESIVRWLGRTDSRIWWLYARIEAMALQANANGFGFDIAAQCGGFHEVQFTEYNANNSGHYDWHEDNNWKKQTPMDRKMSMVIQLSDKSAYQGGRLELKNDPLAPDQFTEQGDTIFFPAFNRHRVTPVTQGVRFSLVTWFIGPKFR